LIKESKQTCLPKGRENQAKKNLPAAQGWRFPVFWRANALK
jgi:hypothetical protein